MDTDTFYTGNPCPYTLSGTFDSDSTMRSLHLDLSANSLRQYVDIPIFDNESSVVVDLSRSLLSLFGKEAFEFDGSLITSPRQITASISVQSRFTDKDGKRGKGDGTPEFVTAVLGRIPDYIPPTLSPFAVSNSLMPTTDYITLDTSSIPSSPNPSLPVPSVLDGRSSSDVPSPLHMYRAGTKISKAYPIQPKQHHLYRAFHFINTFGVSEVVFARTLETASYVIERNLFSRVTPFSATPSPMGDQYIHTSPARRSYQMSSGACSQAWADWWLLEFCNAEHIWMFEPTSITPGVAATSSGKWVPVAVEVGKSSNTYSKSSTTPCHIDFAVSVLHR